MLISRHTKEVKKSKIVDFWLNIWNSTHVTCFGARPFSILTNNLMKKSVSMKFFFNHSFWSNLAGKLKEIFLGGFRKFWWKRRNRLWTFVEQGVKWLEIKIKFDGKLTSHNAMRLEQLVNKKHKIHLPQKFVKKNSS